MVWTNVKSSAIKQIAYRKGLIYIRWIADKHLFYRYGRFTRQQYDDFRNSKSLGAFYHLYIIGTDWTKVRHMQEQLAELVRDLDPDYGKMLTAFTSSDPTAFKTWIGEPEQKR